MIELIAFIWLGCITIIGCSSTAEKLFPKNAFMEFIGYVIFCILSGVCAATIINLISLIATI